MAGKRARFCPEARRLLGPRDPVAAPRRAAVAGILEQRGRACGVLRDAAAVGIGLAEVPTAPRVFRGTGLLIERQRAPQVGGGAPPGLEGPPQVRAAPGAPSLAADAVQRDRPYRAALAPTLPLQ